MTTTIAQPEADVEAGVATLEREVTSGEGPRPRKGGMRAGLLLGLVTGFAGGTLFAPRTGEELLRELREGLQDLAAHPEELPTRVRQRIADLRGRAEAHEGAGGLLEHARTWADAARQRVREAIEQGRAASREAQARLRDEYRRMIGRQN